MRVRLCEWVRSRRRVCSSVSSLLPTVSFSFSEYRLVAKKGEGTFSEVLKAQSTITGEYFAIKCMKSSFKNMDQVNSLREIQALRRLNPHPNIIDLEEVLYDKGSGRLALVFELMDQNVYELIRGRKQPVKPATVKLLMYQLLKAVAHMHKHGIFHRGEEGRNYYCCKFRAMVVCLFSPSPSPVLLAPFSDIKPENVLIVGDHYLKVADFGSCRGIYTQAPYTEYISTRWYRAPEVRRPPRERQPCTSADRAIELAPHCFFDSSSLHISVCSPTATTITKWIAGGLELSCSK